jgi:sulfur carrier protein
MSDDTTEKKTVRLGAGMAFWGDRVQPAVRHFHQLALVPALASRHDRESGRKTAIGRDDFEVHEGLAARASALADVGEQRFDALLSELEYEGTHFAIALNYDVLPKSRWAETALKAGDEIEIITPRQGG